MPEPSEYVPVTVDVARQIARGFEKHIVVIVSVDHRFDKTHFTTYGQAPEDKIIAGRLGEAIAAATGHFMEQANFHEDFRTIDAAERAAENELFKRLVVACDHTLGSLLAVRNGITDEALQSLRHEIQAALKSS